MIKFFVTLSLFATVVGCFGQNKLGKIYLDPLFFGDSQYESKTETLKNYSDSLQNFIDNHPEVKRLREEGQALDTNDRMYRFNAERIYQKISAYFGQAQAMVKQKEAQLFYTSEVQDKLKRIVEENKLDGMLMLKDSSSNWVEGVEFVSAEFETQFAKDIDAHKEKLMEPYKGKSKEEEEGKIITSEGMIRTIMNTDYSNDIMEMYIKNATDFTQALLKE